MSVYISHATALWLMCARDGLMRGPRVPREMLAMSQLPEALSDEDCQPRGALESSDDHEERDAVAWVRERLGVDLRSCLLAPDAGDAGRRPLDVLVGSRSRRNHTATAHRWLWTGGVPEGAFVCLGDGLFLSTPEMVFLEMARAVDLTELVQVGMALCGRYAPSGDDGGFVRHESLTSVARLGEFLGRCDGIRGVKRARSALRWVCDGSRSPMETATVMVLTMSRTAGGYGLPRPELNVRIDLSTESALLAGTPYYRADLLYRKERLVIEYLGKAYHADTVRDYRRERILEDEGFAVVNVTGEQLIVPGLRNRLVGRIAGELGYRLRPATQGIRARRRELVGRVIPSAAAVREDGTVEFERPWWALPAGLERDVRHDGR